MRLLPDEVVQRPAEVKTLCFAAKAGHSFALR